MDAFYIITTAALFSISCSLLGSFLVLRKMAMVGDAISHAVLPGIVLAFLATGTRDSLVILAGAAILGVFATFSIELLHKKARINTGASIGITFTSLFALGVILLSNFAGQIDLDQECVLYGEIAYVPLDLWVSDDGTNLGPIALYVALFVLLINTIFVWIFFKQLYVTSFDPAFAASIGFSISMWNYFLMGAVSFTTVAAFESVGAILIVALLVVPAATGYLLTGNIRIMLLISVFLSIIISILGYYLAAAIDGSIAGAMVTMAGILFGIAYAINSFRNKNKLTYSQSQFNKEIK